MKILSRSGRVLWEGDATSTAHAMSQALAADADLTRADLTGAHLVGAHLAGAHLVGAHLADGVPVIPAIDAAILAAIDRPGYELDMQAWHTCETTHCRAGWAIHLAGEAGRDLELRMGSSAAGALIYAASASHPVPNFHATNTAALADLRERAARSVVAGWDKAAGP